jgi:hypothetical protein
VLTQQQEMELGVLEEMEDAIDDAMFDAAMDVSREMHS